MLNNWMHSKLETPSVLGRVARSRAYSLQRKSDDDPDEAAPSPATLGQIRAYFDAWRIGDEADQERALDKIVKTWRADNAAGGLPVHAHLPLPGKFAKTVAQLLESGSEVQQRPTVDRFIMKLDPSVRVLITHQLATLMERKLPGVEEHGTLPADAGERSRFHSEADAMRWPKHVANADGSDEGLEDVTASIGSARERAVLETRGHGVVGLDAPGDWAIAARPGARSSALDVAEALDARELGPQKNDERVVDDTARPRVRTLEFDPKEDASNVVPLRYVDDEGNIVYEAWELPDGSMPPPRPAYNKMLPIQSTIPNRQRPHGYSSGEYDPTRVGLRKSIDKKTGRVVFKPHHGVDFRANYGDPIRVAADGVVVGVANNVAGYGTVVAVRHPDGTMTLYAHLVPGKVLVRPGQYIRVGTFIGQAGTSGNAGRPQVHFEVWRQAYLTPQGGLDYNRGKQNTIDPYKWFDRPMMPGFTPRHTYPLVRVERGSRRGEKQVRRWVLVPFWCVVIGSSPSAMAEKSVWTVVARCASVADAAPGRGLFEVRYKTRGGDAEAIEVRGCGKNRAFRRVFEWGGDKVRIDFYALPFFEKGKLDFLIEFGWDDSVDFKLMRASRDYAVAVEFTAVASPFFGDADRDGRWEISIENLVALTCANSRTWSADLLKVSQARLSADTLCKTSPSRPLPEL